MTLSVRIICLPSAWPELLRRMGEYRKAINADTPVSAQPVRYWKDERFLLFEQSFSANCDLKDVSANCSRLFGSADYSVLTRNESEIEIASFALLPEMLADSNRAFIYLYGKSTE